MNDIIVALREHGYKMTPQRRALLRALLEGEKFINAQSILENVRSTHPDVGLDTIYRNLRLLMDMGYVNQINNPGREGTLYELTVNKQHHHHSICLSCGKVECLSYCPVHNDQLKKIVSDDFRIISHSLEIYGYCKECEQQV